MTKWMLAAGAAALAMTVPAQAEKGGHGTGGGGHQNQQARGSGHAQHGGGGHAQKANVQRGGREMARTRTVERGHAQTRERFQARGFDKHSNRDAMKVQHARADFGKGKNDRVRVDRNSMRGRDVVRVRDDVREVRLDRGRDTIRFAKDRRDDRFIPRWDNRGLVRYDGCPPGLAKKNNGCLPPGQERKIIGTTLPSTLAASVLGGPYRDWYRDNDQYFYRWDNDYIYRVNRNGGLVDAFFPMADRDYYYYPVGYDYPSAYNYYNVPMQYRSYYPDGGDTWYRYGDGAIYGVNPQTSMIEGIVALLAGDLSVGQPLPSSYSVYNMPLSYRDQYYDTPDAWYRYNDGYIYRVDPKTQLITAVINAIV